MEQMITYAERLSDIKPEVLAAVSLSFVAVTLATRVTDVNIDFATGKASFSFK